MKRKLGFLLAAILCLTLSCAMAESTMATADFVGTWGIAGGSDIYPYLVFHEDGTMESYQYTTAFNTDSDIGLGYLEQQGAWQYDPATATLTLADGSAFYASHETLTESMETDELGNVEAGTVLLHLTVAQGEEPQEAGYAPGYQCRAVPTLESLQAHGWSDGEAQIVFQADGSVLMNQEESGTYAYEGGRLQLTVQGETVQMYVQYRRGSLEELTEEAVEQLDDALLTAVGSPMSEEQEEAFIDENALVMYHLAADGSVETQSLSAITK